MSPERWQRIKELFHAALERPADQRSAFLAGCYGGDEALQREVEELLAHCPAVPEGQAEAATDPGGCASFDPAPQPCPKEIGPYHVLRLLGEGGMGVVYLAERAEPIHQTVAVKVLKPGMDSRRILARFEAERDVLAIMEHPHVARIFDAGMTDEHRPYFVMEYVQGEPITGFCDQRQFSITQRLELFTQVCEAIQHAHQKAVIHRDIKPSNLLVVEQDGRAMVKVIDFGVAKALDQEQLQETLFTEEGILLGTPEYMSPEQAAGVPEAVDTRSDIYSLGVVLYELLAGVLPFERDELRRAGLEAILRTIREADPPHPSTRLRSLGERATEAALRRGTAAPTLVSVLRSELEWIPLKALRKNPEERYRSAAELADDIGNYLSSRPLLAGPESAWYRARKLLRRYKAHVMVAAGFTILLAGSILLVTHMSRANWRLAEAVSSENYYLTCIKAARMALGKGEWDTLRQQLERAPVNRRNWEWHYLEAQYQDQRALSATTSPGRPWGPIDARQPTLLRGHDQWLQSAVFSPDGARIITASNDRTVRIWDSVTGSQLAVLQGHASGVERVAVSPDGRLILTGSADKTARLWDAATGRHVKTLRGHQAIVSAVAFSPDNRLIATGSVDDTARIWDAVTGQELRVLRGHRGDILSVSFSPDGVRVLTASRDQTARIWDVATGRELQVLRGHRDEVVSAAFSPDGACVVTTSEDATVRLWEASTGRELNTLHGHSRRVCSAAFSPDGTRVVSSSTDGTARLWDTATGEATLVLFGPHELFSVSFSPDGRRILAGCMNGDACVWDLRPMRARQVERQAALAAAQQAKPLVHDLHARLLTWPKVVAAIRSRQDLDPAVRNQALNQVLTSCAAEQRGEHATLAIHELCLLARQSAGGVAEGVRAVTSIDPQMDDLGIVGPRELLWYGEYLIIGEQPKRAVEIIKRAMDQGGTEHYYPKDLGWALLKAGRQREAQAALRNALRDFPDWSNGPPATADVDHWTAAYYLGLVTEEQYIQCWRSDPDPEAEQHRACFPWFYIGQLKEIEGKREEAIAAYRRSVLAGRSEDAHWTANFAAYRLGVLTGTMLPPATSRPVAPRSVSTPDR